MADEAYRRAFDRKPRFLPWRRADHGCRRRNRGRRTGGRDAGAAARARGSERRALRGARRFPREKPCGEGIMPAGVAVLERLGLRDAVGGRPLASVRYHGFGMTAEAASRRAPTGRRPSRSASGGWRLDQALLAAARATPGVRVFEEAPVEGAAIEAGARSACASAASCGAAAWWSAPTASIRPCAARWGSIAAARGEAGASACACTTASRPAATSLRASRSSSAAATSCTRRRCPTASCCSPALGDRDALRSERARRRWSAGSASSRCCATGSTARRR